MRPTPTPSTAYVAGIDAANAHMRAAGRIAWSAADYDVAIATQRRVLREAGLFDADNAPTHLYFAVEAAIRDGVISPMGVVLERRAA